MSLRTSIGAIGNLLDERPEHCRRVVVPRPVLGLAELARLTDIGREGFESVTLPTLYPVADGAAGMERAIDEACRAASRAVWDGASIVVLSDRGVDARMAAVPPLLAVAAVHSHLVREGARTMCGLVVESGEPRETMHFALLLGYGAAAVCPYLVLEALPAAERRRYLDGISAGLLKVCSKMGISTVQSYRGAQIFEAVGLGAALVERYFPGTVSRVGGIGLAEVHAASAARHAAAFTGPACRPRGRRRVPAPPRRGAARVGAGADRAPAAGRARRQPRDVPRLRARRRRARGPARDAARAARAGRPRRADRARRGRAVGGDRAPVRDRRDEPRVDLARGARDARDRDEPARRPLEHGRGRRGSRPLDPRRKRRSAPVGDQAGRVGAVRRDGRLPGRRRPAPDQDRPGRQARRGRPAPGREDHRDDRAPAPLDARASG